MGTTVWEPIARILAASNGFSVCDPKQLLKPNPYPQAIQHKVSDLEEQRKSSSGISLVACREEIRQVALQIDRSQIQNFVKPSAGRGVDLYFTKGDREYAFDLKTNQPNRGDGAKFNRQLLDWYAYRFCQNPESQFEARIAFPFNPYEKDWWEQQGKRVSPLTPAEAWVEDKFWDFCSGEEGTWQQIENIFIELGQEENFSREFRDIFYSQDDPN
ncbi:TdeIII family type II restriction endonuclease [Geitlerinema sp. CS-897]|nr:TdeIII family type II restriction endonuclease [Geitlerinema sp. CS-897]